MLCLAVALLSIPGVLLGLLCMAVLGASRLAGHVVRRLRGGGAAPASGESKAEIEFPAMFR